MLVMIRCVLGFDAAVNPREVQAVIETDWYENGADPRMPNRVEAANIHVAGKCITIKQPVAQVVRMLNEAEERGREWVEIRGENETKGEEVDR